MKITLIRGLPGSGKSTLAKKMNINHVEADMFFVSNGKYLFNENLINDAHDWCLSEAKKYLYKQENVVVSNTFIKISDLIPYQVIAMKLGAEVEIIEAKGNYTSLHPIPRKALAQMKKDWEAMDNNLF